MMYFCPCPCNDPIDPETEESTFVHLPRNLSYVQESYLDRYSVSARFVHNPKVERSILHQQNEERRLNVEDETLNLLSAIRAQEFPVRDESSFGGYHSVISSTSTGFYVTCSETPTQTACAFSSPKESTFNTGNWTSVASSPFSASSLLQPASRVASRLSSLLHSPPNESMDSARDIGTSVDAENLSPQAEALVTRADTPQMECPQSLGQEMDRGLNVRFVGYGPSSSSSNQDAGMETVDKYNDEIKDINMDVNQDDSAVDLLENILEPYGIGAKTHYPKSSFDGNVKEDGGEESDTSVSKAHDTASSPSSGQVTSTSFGSPDSDVFSEEGVFMNMDELEDSVVDKSATVSDVSDDTCVSADSMFLSPEEGELEIEKVQEPARKMTLEEAITRAASDLSKMTMTMYGPGVASTSQGVCSDAQDEEEEEEDAKAQPLMKTKSRASPIRCITGLKIKINDQSTSDSETQLSESMTTCSDSPIYPENEFNFSRMELRKSSSLKTNKTPPGTPHRKKVVRFADAMGLDLESVRHVLNMESPPKIPASAMADLQKGLSEERKEIGSKYLCPCFSQPGALDTFVQKVLSQKVSLENAIITDLTITGFVRVANMSFHKSCRVRYTHNSWATFHDIAASYVQNSCDGATDRFSFSIVAPAYFGPGNRLEFAVSYNAGGVEYWDNNDGKNYVFECFAKTVPTDSETAWLHFL